MHQDKSEEEDQEEQENTASPGGVSSQEEQENANVGHIVVLRRRPSPQRYHPEYPRMMMPWAYCKERDINSDHYQSDNPEVMRLVERRNGIGPIRGKIRVKVIVASCSNCTSIHLPRLWPIPSDMSRRHLRAQCRARYREIVQARVRDTHYKYTYTMDTLMQAFHLSIGGTSSLAEVQHAEGQGERDTEMGAAGAVSLPGTINW